MIDSKKTIDEGVSPCSDGRPVIVTTSYRGVFFGYAQDTTGNTVHLKRARNCVYWSKNVKGFIGLAVTGPTRDCRVGPAADFEVRSVTGVLEVLPEAVAAWESAPWA
jgi:hypothetical protein